MVIADDSKYYFKNVPVEVLNTELKDWLNTSEPEHQAKIITACLALYNHDGGFLYIGYNDKGIKQEYPFEVSCTELYHIDVIQRLISNYSTVPIEIRIHLDIDEAADKIKSLMILIPQGVKKPAITKFPNKAKISKDYLTPNKIYVRSLASNGTSSTTEIQEKDWDSLFERCLANREADLGKFISRHLTPQNLQALKDTFKKETVEVIEYGSSGMFAEQSSSNKKAEVNSEALEEKLIDILSIGRSKLIEKVKDQNIEAYKKGFWEVAFFINAKLNVKATNSLFLNIIKSTNPRYTGWPLWVVLLNAPEEQKHPYFDDSDEHWQSCIVGENEIDFWSASARGDFYHYRTLEDDIRFLRSPEPLTQMDWSIPIWRVMEALAVSIEFAKGLGSQNEHDFIALKFKWSKLKGRILTSWASHSNQFIFGSHTAYRDEVTSYIEIPIMASKDSYYKYAYTVLEPLYEAFAYKIDIELIEEVAGKFLRRERLN